MGVSAVSVVLHHDFGNRSFVTNGHGVTFCPQDRKHFRNVPKPDLILNSSISTFVKADQPIVPTPIAGTRMRRGLFDSS
jgi:hypothetical protein